MPHFHYLGGVLHAEDLPLPAIATTVGTPALVCSTAPEAMLSSQHVPGWMRGDTVVARAA